MQNNIINKLIFYSTIFTHLYRREEPKKQQRRFLQTLTHPHTEYNLRTHENTKLPDTLKQTRNHYEFPKF